MEDNKGNEREELYSQRVRAGKRTYFFDVRTTRGGDYYVTITESKKFTNEDGTFYYKKHKIYLYKEDFDEFNNSDYVDVHCWQFTPESFHLIMNQLHILGLINPISSLEIYPNIGEFYIALKFD